MKLEITYTHEIERDGEDVYVIERQNGQGGYTRFGPMPRDFAGPFIDERQEFLRDGLKSAVDRLLKH